ncbi:MAG: CoA-binding protein [Vicinamibacterales bacterium]
MTKTVAVIGASSDRRKYGNRAVRAFLQRGHRVVPINPKESEVEGLRAYASVLDVPHPIDMATFYVAPPLGMRIIEEVAQKGITEVWLNPGADSPDLVERARELGLQPIVACSIMAIGQDPHAL